jgi:hypothetical protein
MQIDKKNIHYIDIPGVAETFIDSFHYALFDGTTFRIELCATRMDEPKPPAPPTAQQYPICRLVMPPQTMLDLFNQLQTFVNALIQQGILKKEPLPTIPPQSKH